MRKEWLYRARVRNFLALAGIGGGSIVLVLALFLFQPPLLRQIDLKLYDHYLAGTSRGTISPVPLIIDIDEKTLERFGQWPWPRYRLSLMLERLLGAGAAAVALDIVLAEEDRTSPNLLLRALKEDLGVEASLEGLPDPLRDNDKLMARTIKDAPVVLGGFVGFDRSRKQTPLDELPPGVTLVERRKPRALPAEDGIHRGQELIWPVETLLGASKVGFFNVSLDQDGLVRRAPMLLRVGDQTYGSLALRALMTALGSPVVRLTSGPDGLERIGLGRLSFPVAPDATVLVPYRGPAGTFPYLSAGKILDNDFDPEELRGRILFVGTSAAGLQDFRSTPLDRYTPGVEVHANIVDAVLTGRSLLVPPWNTGLQALLVTLTGIACTALFGGARPAFAVAGGVGLLLAYYFGAEYFFRQGLYVTPLWGMLATGAEGTGVLILRLWRAERDKRRIRNVFSRYVSPEIVSNIVERGEVVLRGEERELSIMFTDLRGFTSLSEHLSPVQVVSLLNRYFTPMTALVRGSRGTLDKFIGDALMAFWNAPLDVADHPRRAVSAALAMHEALAGLNAELEKTFGVRLRMGAGIHTGLAYVGNMGSDDLTSYTAIGDAVNLASRLEGLCPRYGVPLTLSGETAARCGEDVVLQRLATLRVKGRREPVSIFTAMRPQEAEARAEELALYAEALALRDEALAEKNPEVLSRSRTRFARLSADPRRHPLYSAYAEECDRLLGTSPDAWDGVWTLTGK